jgi:hypothetical protein
MSPVSRATSDQMAARAKSPSKLMSLADALALGVKVYGSPSLVRRLIEEALATGKVPWTCKRVEASVPKTHPLAAGKPKEPFWGEPAFWHRSDRHDGPFHPFVHLRINWEEGWAESRGVESGIGGQKTLFVVRAWAILLPRAAVEAVFVVSGRRAGPGTERTYDHEAIRAVAKEVLKRGRDAKKAWFFEKVRDACRGKMKAPENDTTMNRLVGDLWGSGAPSRGQT